MRTNKYILLFTFLLSFVFITSSCINDLDTIPLDKDELVSDVVFGKDRDAYIQGLAKLYAGLAIGGNEGGDAEQDVVGIDGGSQASFIRVLWNMQELPSDMAHCAWNDPGIPDFNQITWGASSPWIKGSYYRLFYQIGVANAFLRETTADKLEARGASPALQDSVKTFRAEARLLRAMTYAYALDLYRNVPFVTEESPIGNILPEQITANDLFDYIEQELLECETDLLDPIIGYNQNYGHVTKSAAWAILSRLYLNAEVYIGQAKYTECITYSKKVIDAGHELEPVYGDMFKADNHLSKEMILPVRYEGNETLTWGGMTFLLCQGASALQQATNAKDAWQGYRAKSSLLALFEKQAASDNDTRKSMLHTDLTTDIEITDQSSFENNGIPVAKFYNVNKDGSLPPSSEAYIDYPLFRLGEIYLNYIEAVLRGGQGGTRAEALQYMNELRIRAYTTGGTISETQLTLDFVLDERGRELFWEAHRRTDMVRFGRFTTGTYVWPWKGGVADGRAVSSHFNIYPIPSDDIGTNTNLTQNTGY